MSERGTPPAQPPIAKRHKIPRVLSNNLPPPKRLCTPDNAAIKKAKLQPDIKHILSLPEDAVWGLRKSDLRAYFLALRSYTLNPYPLSPSILPTPNHHSSNGEASGPLPPFLLLPLEIREQIYSYLLPPAVSPPIRGPHPRQLQTALQLTQPIPACLLAVSQQVRREALPLLWGAPTQIVHLTIDYNIWVHKTRRSDLVLSSSLTSSIRHIHLSIHLGSEKLKTRPGDIEADARLSEVKKGIKKLGKWVGGADIQSLRISWQEPPQTYGWEQKREVLSGLKALRAVQVEVGEINWGLGGVWNKGKKYRFEVEYLKELERDFVGASEGSEAEK